MSAQRGEPIECVVYAQVEPEWSRMTTRDGERYLDRVKVTAVRQTPRPPHPGHVTVKLRLRFPADVFYPLLPEAVVEVLPAMVRSTPIEVTAQEPEPEPEP